MPKFAFLVCEAFHFLSQIFISFVESVPEIRLKLARSDH